MIDPTKLQAVRIAAQRQVRDARDRVRVQFNGRAPAHVQLGTYHYLKTQPDLIAKVKAERGEDGWSAYVQAMEKLDKELSNATH